MKEKWPMGQSETTTIKAEPAVRLRAGVQVRGSLWARLWTVEHRRWVFCYAGLLPILVLYLALRIIPIIRTFALSLYESNLINLQSQFIGLANYWNLFQDELFQTALKNTTLFAIATVALSVTIGLALALMMNYRFRLSPLYETIYFLPVITPMVPVAIIWKWIYDPSFGLLNYILSWFGVKPIGWLVYPDIALWAIVILSVWKVVGYNMVIFLVGLRNIPTVYYEAAAIDGAGGSSLFRHITMPLLKPIILFIVVVTTINAYNVFTQVYVMTTGLQGAPGNTVRVLVYDIWENAFRYFRMGYASAEAVILFIIVLILTLIQFRLIRSEA
jgi:multiple sugar transport system permease protein